LYIPCFPNNEPYKQTSGLLSGDADANDESTNYEDKEEGTNSLGTDPKLLMARNSRPTIRRCNALDSALTTIDTIDYVYNNKRDQLIVIVQQLFSDDDDDSSIASVDRNDENDVDTSSQKCEENDNVEIQKPPLSSSHKIINRRRESLSIPSPFAGAKMMHQNDKTKDIKLSASKAKAPDYLEKKSTVSTDGKPYKNALAVVYAV